ncbi:MAG: LicD family protein [Lachnospiraceae bacterium]|nr:LicD family protein [Lachnospiraceae bacterium]
MLHFEEDFFQEEERNGFVISGMMKRAWAAQLEVLEEIRRVCKELDISFFADWGTMLGAVRHQGYIPWDDDLDIGMLRNDYMTFLEHAPERLDSWYELKSVYNDPTDDIVKARIINGRHINFDKEFLEHFHYCPYVVGIDVFPVDHIPSDRKELDALVDSLKFLLKVEASIPEEGPYDEEVLSLMKNIEEKFGVAINYNNRLRHEVKKIFDIVSSRYMDEPTSEVSCMLALAADWDWYHCDKKWYDSYIEMPFENTTIPVPIGYDGILRCNYGEDYMTPRNAGSSHDYPFYKEQMIGLKEVMEAEFQTKLTDEQMEMLINAKLFG